MSSPILGFFNSYHFLSNFYLCDVEYDGLVYPSSENAFQAAKCERIAERNDFVNISPNKSKQKGHEVQMRSDWDEVKFQVMYDICKCKFTQNPILREKLIATGDAYLEETNTWGDRIWGVCNGVGENNLGKILMRIREELQ